MGLFLVFLNLKLVKETISHCKEIVDGVLCRIVAWSLKRLSMMLLGTQALRLRL